MLVEALLPILALNDCVSTERPIWSQNRADTGHQLADFSFSEMLNCSVPHNVREGPTWDISSNISPNVTEVWRLEVATGPANSLVIEVDGSDGLASE